MQKNYIVVEGPIGVGKTSLANRLANTFSANLLTEEAVENPFLQRFYQKQSGAALATQLCFLLQRSRQLEKLSQSDLFAPRHVADYLLDKDRLFAELTLDAAELDLYDQIYQQLSFNVPVPDLVIYLQAPVDILSERIAKRGIVYEQTIEASYLQRLVDAYTRFFHQYQASALLIVNAEFFDPVSNDEDYQQLLERIEAIHSGRHFFNPLPFAMG